MVVVLALTAVLGISYSLTLPASVRLGERPAAESALDIVRPITIMTAFYELPSMPHDCFPRVVKHAKILRTKDRAGAKSTPNTPLILQEIK